MVFCRSTNAPSVRYIYLFIVPLFFLRLQVTLMNISQTRVKVTLMFLHKGRWKKKKNDVIEMTLPFLINVEVTLKTEIVNPHNPYYRSVERCSYSHRSNSLFTQFPLARLWVPCCVLGGSRCPIAQRIVDQSCLLGVFGRGLAADKVSRFSVLK